MANSTTRHNTELSPVLSIGIATITGIPIIINIIYVIVCFKALRKKLHNLLVLSLCISDSFLGISLTWYIIGSLVDSIKTNVGACLFQTFAVCYGLVTSYGLILIICLERYAVIRNMNFGIQETMDRFKYLLISGSLAYEFVYTIETIMFTPHQETIASCSLPNLYGDQFSFFITFMSGFITFIMLLIIAVTFKTSYHIWRIFYGEKKTHPMDLIISNRNGKDAHSTCDKTIVSGCDSSTKPKTTESSRTKSKLQLTGSKDEGISSTNSCLNSQDISTVTQPTTSTAKNTATSPTEDGQRHTTQIQELIKRLKLDRQEKKISLKETVPPIALKKKQFKFDAWEFRAFATSILIAFTTMLFTGPLVFSYWIDVYTGTFMPQQTRFILFIPLVMNSIFNPFIYAWRIPEIRQEFKRLFTCPC